VTKLIRWSAVPALIALFASSPAAARPGIEASCDELGANCLCSAPLNNASWETLVIGRQGGTGDKLLARSPNDVKPCQGEIVGSGPNQGMKVMTIARERSVEQRPAASVDLPPTASGINYVYNHKGNGGGRFGARLTVNNQVAVNPIKRICTRYYFRWHEDTPNYYMSTGCNQKNHEVSSNSQDERYVVPFHTHGSVKTLAGVRIGLPPGNKLFDDNAVHSNGWDLATASNGGAYLNHCLDEWCRVEICTSYTGDFPQDWSGFAIDAYIETVETRKRTQLTTPPAGPLSGADNLSNFSMVNHYFPSLGDGTGGTYPQQCSLAGGGRMYSHIMLAAWPTNEGQYIGAASEMEGGGVNPPPPAATTPAAPILLPALQ
jgi:hypothetical protein